MVIDLAVENAQLRVALREEWEANHAEHCGFSHPLPHDRSVCGWPLPELLEESDG